jgi:branched-chain amino acid transport system substrate-binding protein
VGWIASYKQKFNADPNGYTAIGYAQEDLFVMAARKADPNLTTDNFAEALETLERAQFSRTDHLGSRATRLAQIRNGRRENITDYIE